MTQNDNTLPQDDQIEEVAPVSPVAAQNDETPTWLEEADDEYEQAADPAKRVRFLTTSGPRDVYIEAAMPLRDVLLTGSLTFATGAVFQIDGANADMSTMVQPGAVITAIGMVKGGLG